MIKESISKMENGKTTEPSGVVSEMLKEAEKAGFYMITHLINQVKVKGVILAEWKPSTIVNCYKGKEDSLERGSYSEDC